MQKYKAENAKDRNPNDYTIPKKNAELFSCGILNKPNE